MSQFRFNPAPTVWAKVRLSVPTETGFESQDFRAKFLILPQSERQAMAEHGLKAALARIWLDWDEVADLDGKPLPFSAALRDELLEFDYVEMGVGEAYARAAMGIETKN
ncbi:hypothetical protein [Roseovarius autotrophicus]|uniref:hypothetical protein n=1 Tax=Roseovarius autotrophicus TaxID=2824121 RepID=UPI0019E77D14|nr:hypothetical protein [Roseovarius autotrophicus]MBE0455634.1 hypothetical protein [Roseovarius sp.]